MKARRAGHVLAEGVVTFGLAVLVGAAICSAIITQSRLARSVAERIAFNNALRAAVHILPAELRFIDAASDLRAAGGDSVAGRWTRSSGIVCATAGSNIWVRLIGMRQPDATKDSILIINADGERAYPIMSATMDAAGCAGDAGETIYRLRVTTAATAGVVAIFESGSYYLAQRALRYRVGAEGRQPLTEEYFTDGASGIELQHDDTAAAARFVIDIALKPQLSHTSGRITRHTITLLNSIPPDGGHN